MRRGAAFSISSRTARYLLVGIIGAFVEATVFALLIRAGFGIVVSNMAAFHIAFILCYFMHYRYTHRKPFAGAHAVIQGLGKYAGLMYGQLVLGTVLLWVLIMLFGMNPDLSKIAQMCIVTPASYFLQSRFIFRQGKVQ